MKAICRNKMLWVGLFVIICACHSARANVYATDIRLNGSLQAGVVVPGSPLTISFILNEAATHVSVQICAGSNVVKTFAASTNAGLNTVVWNGTNDDGGAAAVGVYNVSITAAAAGYDSWTNITDDGANFFVSVPTGIAVNKNTNSPYYGRVFVGNTYAGNGMGVGILKCNSDGSAAEEGGFGTGGYAWSGGGSGAGYDEPSPWMMDIGSDDRLYVDDWFQNGAANGVVVSFDQVLSTNYFSVLEPDNYPYAGISLSGPCVCGEGTNMQIYMADINTVYLGGLGILCWTLNSNGVIASNDTGTVEVTLTNNSDLTLAPYAVSVDASGDIYTIQRDETNDPNPRVLCFPPPPASGPPDTTALWKIGGGNPALVNSYGVAVDPTATFVAVASRGYNDGNGPDALADGGISIFFAASGSLVTNINQDPAGNTNQEMIDVAWDNVGNLYANDFSDSVWRVYSPPGSNQATTVAVPIIQVYHALAPPQLSVPTNCMGQMNFTLTGQSNVTYVIQQSPDLINWTPVATNFSPTTVLSISVSPPDAQDFYRAMASP
jgi:hypothetical protein